MTISKTFYNDVDFEYEARQQRRSNDERILLNAFQIVKNLKVEKPRRSNKIIELCLYTCAWIGLYTVVRQLFFKV